jgi:hypothetical protein
MAGFVETVMSFQVQQKAEIFNFQSHYQLPKNSAPWSL